MHIISLKFLDQIEQVAFTVNVVYVSEDLSSQHKWNIFFGPQVETPDFLTTKRSIMKSLAFFVIKILLCLSYSVVGIMYANIKGIICCKAFIVWEQDEWARFHHINSNQFHGKSKPFLCQWWKHDFNASANFHSPQVFTRTWRNN